MYFYIDFIKKNTLIPKIKGQLDLMQLKDTKLQNDTKFAIMHANVLT